MTQFSARTVDLLTRLNAALQGRYRLERALGEGGMATVYLATDLRHQRAVALKVLKPELAVMVGAERFLAEITTTANLHHPYILPLYDSGEADKHLFYTMPYVEGETLRQRLDREGRLMVDEATRLVVQIAEALQAAHDRGVVHRDIKPSNILLSRGQPLVADFGIARATGGAGLTRLTQSGMSIGTLGYMSPEQASGDPALDHRTDIYSLGCVLFEMLTGARPHPGRTALEVLARQATDPVPSVRVGRPDVSTDLDRAVSTALAREPARRYDTMSAFAAALAARGADTRHGVSAARALLVLPFVNRSADPDNEYFSDGLTDEVIADLSRVSALRVISRNSAMALKGTTKDTPTLARELGLTHLMTGTVRRAGSSLRITVELVDAITDSPIWSEKFSGSMDDVFGIQEEISRQIVAALKVSLTAAERHGAAERPIDDPVAYDCYLRACQLMYRWTPDAQRDATRLVDQATAIVGDAPLLLAMKGQLQWNLVNIPSLQAEGALARAAGFAERALAGDPDCYLAIFVRGLVTATGGRPEAGLADLYRAHTLRLADANVLVEFCRFSLASGLRLCRIDLEQLARIDPLGAQTHLLHAMYHGVYGAPEAAAPHVRRAIELAPDASILHVSAGWWLARARLRQEAASIFDRVAAAGGWPSALARFFRCALDRDEAGARQAATPELEQAITNEWFLRQMADAYAAIGHLDGAMRALRAAVGFGFINYPNLSADPFLDSVRRLAECQALLAEVKPRWEAAVEWESRK